MLQRAAIAVILLSSTAARADDEAPEAVDPMTFQDVLPPERGEVAARFTVSGARDVMSTDVLLEPRAQLITSVADRLGAELEVPMSVRLGPEREVEIGGIAIGLSYAVIERNPHISVLVEMRAPTGEGEAEVRGGLGAAYVRHSVVAQAMCAYRVGHERAIDAGASLALALPHGFHAIGEATMTSAEPGVWIGPALKYRVAHAGFVAAAAMFTTAEDANHRAMVQLQYGF